jgi:hypothetical protein
MNRDVPIWQFCASVDNIRARMLHSYPDFDTVASLVLDAAIEAFCSEPFSGLALRGCHRASFLLRVPEVVYDAFFNSPVGYRGQFAASEGAGELANRQLIAQFEARLLAYAEGRASVTQQIVSKSLRAEQAKLWIFEPEVEAQLGATTPAINYSPWGQASNSGVGLLAPVGTRLEIKGGWLGPDGVEYLNPRKAGRSDDIHRTGFS